MGTRLLAGTDSSLPSEPVPSSTDSSLQLAEPTRTKGQFGSEVGRAHAMSGEDSSSALPRTAPHVSACVPQRFLRYPLHP